MEAKIKSGTFLAESCGRASDVDPSPQRPPPPQNTPFFWRRPLDTLDKLINRGSFAYKID